MTNPARVIEVFADVVCPFTYVGLTRVIEERDRRGADLGIRVRAWPLEIVNGRPVDPAHIAREIEDLRRQVAPELFGGFDVDVFPATSIPALALADAAYQVDDRVGEAVAMDLRRELFERGRDIAEPAVLDEVARRHAIAVRGDRDAVLRDHAEGVKRGVIGSPHFFVGDWSAFCPVLDIAKDDGGRFLVSIDEAGMATFLQRCFG